jgi:hypothetical protein
MTVFVCVQCPGKVACTLFYPEDERTIGKPAFCGPDSEGTMRMTKWMEVPKDLQKLSFVN